MNKIKNWIIWRPLIVPGSIKGFGFTCLFSYGTTTSMVLHKNYNWWKLDLTFAKWFVEFHWRKDIREE
jgi:hypothetical protein